MSDRVPGVPDTLIIHPDSVAVSYWHRDDSGPRWIDMPPPADESWRSVMDLPATLDSEVTVGSFIRLFEYS